MEQSVPPPMTFQLQSQMEMVAPPELGYFIRLIGDPASLDALHGRLRRDAGRVVSFEGLYFLISEQLNADVPEWELKRCADNLIERINAVGKLALDNFRPIGFDAILWNKPDGRYWLTFQSQNFVYPGPVIARSGERIEATITFEELCLALLHTHPEIDEALRLYGREDYDWVTLYRLFEIIEHQVDGPLASKGWVPKSEISRFSATSQHPAVVGNESRHGHVPQQPIKNPMNRIEARDFTRKLLDGWFRQLYSESGSERPPG